MALCRGLRSRRFLKDGEQFFPPDKLEQGFASLYLSAESDHASIVHFLTIRPQAIRGPAFPAGSDFISSGAPWITSAVPPFEKIE